MPDAAYRNASAKRDALAKEINTLQQQVHDRKADLKAVEDWLVAWRMYAGLDAEIDAYEPMNEEHSANSDRMQGSEDELGVPPTERSRTTGNPKKEIVATEARQIIADAGEPVSRADMLRELGERGIVIEGKDPEQVLSTMLWRMRKPAKIVRVPTGGYWWAELPHKASGYLPEHAADVVGQILNTPVDELNGVDVEDMDDDDAKVRHDELSAEIAEADHLYHSEDAPEISDADYDKLRRELEQIEARFPALGMAGDASVPNHDDLRDAQIDLESQRRKREGVFE